jgi:hypothetical protein
VKIKSESGFARLPGFSKQARPLRAHFESLYSDPRKAPSERFVWDIWHVPGQYSHFRTPAHSCFPNRLYDPFHQSLVQWGRENLGCHDISPPWLSLYLDGSYQDWHADRPHGPWAFVFSLSPVKRVFQGGETLLLAPEVLRYWEHSGTERSFHESSELLIRLPSRFNELLVFDPRIPHRVSEVRGTRDPREGRLVMHGWFVQPRPFIHGPVKPRDVQNRLDDLVTDALPQILQSRAVQGMASFRLTIGTSGKVSAVSVLCHSLQPDRLEGWSAIHFLREISRALSQWQFQKQKSMSKITLPLVFEW